MQFPQNHHSKTYVLMKTPQRIIIQLIIAIVLAINNCAYHIHRVAIIHHYCCNIALYYNHVVYLIIKNRTRRINKFPAFHAFFKNKIIKMHASTYNKEILILLIYHIYDNENSAWTHDQPIRVGRCSIMDRCPTPTPPPQIETDILSLYSLRIECLPFPYFLAITKLLISVMICSFIV